MRIGKKVVSYLSVIVIVLLLFGFAGFANASSPAPGSSGLEKAREALEEKLAGLPGFAGICHSEEEGVIIVFLENEQAKGKVPDRFEGFPVLKQVTGKFEALGSKVMEAVTPLQTSQLTRTGEVRPLVGGISLSAYISGTSYAGTLGMVTYNNKILSNAHVIAMNPNTAKFLALGTPTIQPGSYDGGTLANRVGGLEKYIPITFQSPTKPNYADAAIASIDSTVTGSSGVQLDEGANYQVSGTTAVAAGDSVRKSGRTSSVTYNSVYVTNASVKVFYTWSKWAYFKDQIVVYQPFILAGDSGSCVDKGGSFVGLAFAASSDYAIVCKASYIISGLGISVSP